MGSSRPHHSTGGKAGAIRARKGKRKTLHRKPSPSSATRTTGVLASFDEAFTLVVTAASAMESALDPTVVKDAAEPAEKIECLVRGVRGLRRARIEIATALYQREGGLP